MSKTWQLAPLFVILLAAITITHTISSFVLFLILLGIYLVRRLSKTNLVNPSLVTLTVVVFFAYQLYIAVGISNFLFSFIPLTMRHLFHGEFFSYLAGRIISANLGGGIPLWANIASSFWLLLMAFGGLLGLRNLLKVNSLRNVEKMEVGGLAGIALFLAISGVATQMTEAINRGLFYLPLFAIAIVLRFSSNLRGRAKKLTLVVFILLLFVLSFPTFLAHNDAVGTSTLHPPEIVHAEFLGSNYKQTEGLSIFVSVVHPYFINYHALNLQKFIVFPPHHPPATPSEIWLELDNFVKRFSNPAGNHTNILLFTPRYASDTQDFLGSNPTADPRWKEAEDRLAEENIIYNNGFAKLYQAGGKR